MHPQKHSFEAARAGGLASPLEEGNPMKLFRFRYSPYARKVQVLLDLMGTPHEVVDVPYLDRDELARLTGGHIEVPVLVDDAGVVTVESRDICEKLTREPAGARLVPAPFEGPIWGYA